MDKGVIYLLFIAVRRRDKAIQVYVCSQMLMPTHERLRELQRGSSNPLDVTARHPPPTLNITPLNILASPS